MTQKLLIAALAGLLAGPTWSAEALSPTAQEMYDYFLRYEVVEGDSLWKISKDKWGKGALYPALARENSLDPANILHVKHKIKYKDETPVLSVAEVTYVAAAPGPGMFPSAETTPEAAQASAPEPTAVKVSEAPKATAEPTAKPSPVATQVAKLTPSAKPSPAATTVAKTENETPQNALTAPASATSGQHLAIGMGYPDLRLRYGFGPGLVAEGKFAFDAGIQVYTARLSWNFQDLGPLKIMASTEAGFANLNNVDTVTGNGATAGASLGLEYPFANKFRVSVDAGPMWISASAGPANFSTVDVVYNTALYFYLY